MKVIVYSKNPLTVHDKQNIQDIMRMSKCPEVSLEKTFSRFDHMEINRIFFDDVDRHVRTEVEY